MKDEIPFFSKSLLWDGSQAIRLDLDLISRPRAKIKKVKV